MVQNESVFFPVWEILPILTFFPRVLKEHFTPYFYFPHLFRISYEYFLHTENFSDSGEFSSAFSLYKSQLRNHRHTDFPGLLPAYFLFWVTNPYNSGDISTALNIHSCTHCFFTGSLPCAKLVNISGYWSYGLLFLDAQETSWHNFKECVARLTGGSENSQRMWQWHLRMNGTYCPDTPLERYTPSSFMPSSVEVPCRFCMFPKSNFKGSTQNRVKSLFFSQPRNGLVLRHLAHFFPIPPSVNYIFRLDRWFFFRSRRSVAPVKASTLLSEVFTSQLLPGSNMKTIGVKAFDCLMPPAYLHISVAKKVKTIFQVIAQNSIKNFW